MSRTLSGILNQTSSLAPSTASDVPYVPNGDVQSTNVQGAISELDLEKQSLIAPGTVGTFYRGDKVFVAVPHDTLSLVQGGLPAEQYHLTEEEYTGTGTGPLVRRDGPLVRFNTRLITADATADATDYTIRAEPTNLDISITLPDASLNHGRQLVIKKIGHSANTVIASPVLGQTIDNSPNATISQPFLTLTLHSNGANWDII